MAAPEEVTFRWLLLSAVGLMLLIGGGLIAFLLAYQRRILAQQKQLRQRETAHQQQLLAATIEAQEQERARIGRDLHDGLGSTIATAKLLVHRLEQTTPQGNAELFRTVTDILSTAVQDTRRISHNLYPASFSHFGLSEALRQLISVSEKAAAVHVQLEIDYPAVLPAQYELALFRICQELITNALRHARGATLLTVSLRPEGSGLVLTITDDGCGFDTATPAHHGAGLRSVDARVRMLGAHLQCASAPGQGTRVTIDIPLPGKA